jgi:hypothetical protein
MVCLTEAEACLYDKLLGFPINTSTRLFWRTCLI